MPQTELDEEPEEFEQAMYHISHDVRAPLRAVRQISDWLREDIGSAVPGMPKDFFEYLDTMDTQVKRADMILLDIRTFSRVGRIADRVSEIDLASAIYAARDNLRPPNGFRTEVCVVDASLMASFNEMQLLFETLISNAVKHHDRDVGVIEIASVERAGMLVITVTDDGPGIPEKFHKRVFDMMSTLKSRDVCEGSGLGLPIARKIVRALGGSIRVAPTEQTRGCTIEILIPRRSRTQRTAA